MSVTQAFFTGYSSSSRMLIDIEEMAQLGVHAVFRARPFATTHHVLGQLERRERIVLLLLDGKRTIQDVARLTHRSELDVARTLVHLLKRGYVDFLGAHQHPGPAF